MINNANGEVHLRMCETHGQLHYNHPMVSIMLPDYHNLTLLLLSRICKGLKSCNYCWNVSVTMVLLYMYQSQAKAIMY